MAKHTMENVTTKFEEMFGTVTREFNGSIYTIDRVMYSSANHVWAIYDMSTTSGGRVERRIQITKHDTPHITVVPSLVTAEMFPYSSDQRKKYDALPDYVARGLNDLCELKTRQR